MWRHKKSNFRTMTAMPKSQQRHLNTLEKKIVNRFLQIYVSVEEKGLIHMRFGND